MLNGVLNDEIVRDACCDLESGGEPGFDEDAVPEGVDDGAGNGAHDGRGDCGDSALMSIGHRLSKVAVHERKKNAYSPGDDCMHDQIPKSNTRQEDRARITPLGQRSFVRIFITTNDQSYLRVRDRRPSFPLLSSSHMSSSRSVPSSTMICIIE